MSVGVTILEKKENSLERQYDEFVLRLDRGGQEGNFTFGHLIERSHEVRDEDYSRNYSGNFETEDEDKTTHCKLAVLHIYADDPGRGLLDIYEVVDEI